MKLDKVTNRTGNIRKMIWSSIILALFLAAQTAALPAGPTNNPYFASRFARAVPPPENSAAFDGPFCPVTAAYGSPLASQAQLLREFRDRHLLPHAAGRAFVRLYYALSPHLAEPIARSEILRAIVRAGLIPILGWVALVLWSPSLGFGISLIVLVLGTWLAVPVAKRRHWAVAIRRWGSDWEQLADTTGSHLYATGGEGRIVEKLTIW